MKVKTIIATAGVVAFAGAGVYEYANKNRTIENQKSDISSKSVKIDKLNVKVNKLSTEKQKIADKLNKAVEYGRKENKTAVELAEENHSLKVNLQNKRRAEAEARKQAQQPVVSSATKSTPKTLTAEQPRVAVSAPSGCSNISSTLLAYGISQADLPYALNIAAKESSCRWNAVNANGGACGYFQELPCGKWGGTSNVAGHVKGADNYAKSRYGGWAQAWAAWQSKKWW